MCALFSSEEGGGCGACLSEMGVLNNGKFNSLPMLGCVYAAIKPLFYN